MLKGMIATIWDSLSKLSPSDWAAWYAAALASGVAFFDFIKWKGAGPRIKATVNVGWRMSGDVGVGDADVVIAKVINKGDLPTTITHLAVYWWPPGSKLNHKAVGRKLMLPRMIQSVSDRFPTKIEPGSTWTAVMEQCENLNTLMATGTAKMVLRFSHSDKEVLLDLKKESDDPNGVNLMDKAAPVTARSRT
jgi:hypothetical protein